MLLGEVAFVGAAPATSAEPGVAPAVSFVGAAADMDLSAKVPDREKALSWRRVKDRRAGRSAVPKQKQKKKGKEENNGHLIALPRICGLTTYKQI
jgi:hypothetical protein